MEDKEYPILNPDEPEILSFDVAYKTLAEAGFTNENGVKLEHTREFGTLWALYVAIEQWMNEEKESKPEQEKK